MIICHDGPRKLTGVLLCERKCNLPHDWGPALQQGGRAPSHKYARPSCFPVSSWTMSEKPCSLGICKSTFLLTVVQGNSRNPSGLGFQSNFVSRPVQVPPTRGPNLPASTYLGTASNGDLTTSQSIPFSNSFKFLRGHLPPQNLIHWWYLLSPGIKHSFHHVSTFQIIKERNCV